MIIKDSVCDNSFGAKDSVTVPLENIHMFILGIHMRIYIHKTYRTDTVKSPCSYNTTLSHGTTIYIHIYICMYIYIYIYIYLCVCVYTDSGCARSSRSRIHYNLHFLVSKKGQVDIVEVSYDTFRACTRSLHPRKRAV